jgi:hypothetical protein
MVIEGMRKAAAAYTGGGPQATHGITRRSALGRSDR